jgi:hypothetical protein
MTERGYYLDIFPILYPLREWFLALGNKAAKYLYSGFIHPI